MNPIPAEATNTWNVLGTHFPYKVIDSIFDISSNNSLGWGCFSFCYHLVFLMISVIRGVW